MLPSSMTSVSITSIPLMDLGKSFKVSGRVCSSFKHGINTAMFSVTDEITADETTKLISNHVVDGTNKNIAIISKIILKSSIIKIENKCAIATTIMNGSSSILGRASVS